jgi:hypothetical protein
MDALRACAAMKEDGSIWRALEALRTFLQPPAIVVRAWQEDAWQGTYYAVLEHGGRWFLWTEAFGSCGGCDGYENATRQDAFDQIMLTLSIGNTLPFQAEADLANHVRAEGIGPGTYPEGWDA